jgi:hypothetical protein
LHHRAGDSFNRRNSTKSALAGIHSELLMLRVEIAESTVARYMTRRQGPPSQGWKTFLRNHAAGIASIDLFVVRTISFKLLYGLVILHVICLNVESRKAALNY